MNNNAALDRQLLAAGRSSWKQRNVLLLRQMESQAVTARAARGAALSPDSF